jgi:heptaprenyl diphosphate synthase
MNRKLALVGLFVGVGSILFTIESFVSLPIPWFRIGLANAVTVLALEWWGLREALLIVTLRTVLGSVMTGKLFHPDFAFSFAGGIVSALAMWPAARFGKKWFGTVGVSIIGALAKNAAQVALAYAFFVRNIHLFSIFPFFLAVSLLSGIVVGFLAGLVERGPAGHFPARGRN